jgi:hypothetical protein
MGREPSATPSKKGTQYRSGAVVIPTSLAGEMVRAVG